MFRWGILSTAKIAREQVIPAVLASANGTVAAVASRDAERAREVAARWQIPHPFGSYGAMLASPAIDGVYIATPTAHHVEDTLAAIAAGKHVLCEKPMALSAAAIERVRAASEAAGVLVAEAFMVHYHPQWAQVRQWIADGAIGELRQVQGAFSYFNEDPANLRNRPALGGGAVFDIGVYPTVTTRIATGREPQSVRARLERDPRFGTDRYADVQMDFDGFELRFYVSSQMHPRQSMHFAGTRGWIAVEAPFNPISYGHAVVRLLSAQGEQLQRFAANQYTVQAQAFAEAAGGGENRCFSLADSLANQRAIDAIFAAEAAGAAVGLA